MRTKVKYVLLENGHITKYKKLRDGEKFLLAAKTKRLLRKRFEWYIRKGLRPTLTKKRTSTKSP